MKFAILWTWFFALFLVIGLKLSLIRSGFPPEVAPRWTRQDWVRWVALSAILAAVTPRLIHFAWAWS